MSNVRHSVPPFVKYNWGRGHISHESGSCLIIESRYARNHRPQFQAEFGVAEEEPDGPKLALASVPLTTPLPSPVPHPGSFPMGGVAETRKAPAIEGASV